MSDTSRIGLPPLPRYPGTQPAAPGDDAAATANTDAASAAQLASVLGIGPQAAGGGRRDAGDAGTGAAARPPPAPATTVTAQTAAHYASFQAEVQGALNAATASHSNPPWPSGPSINPAVDPKGAEDQAAAWMQNIMQGLSRSQGDLLLAFMKLRLHDAADGMRELENMSDGDAAMQKHMMEQQEAHTKLGQDAADKAQKKGQQLHAVSIAASVAMLALTAIVAVLTFGTAAPLVAIAAAAVIGFVVAGAVGGHGHGFDVMKALDGATYAADAMMMLIGVGAALEAVNAALKAGVEQASRAAAKAAEKQAVKAAAEQAAQTAGRAAAGTALRTGSEVAESVLGKQALSASERMIAKEVAEQAAAAQLKDKAFLARFREAWANGAARWGFRATAGDKATIFTSVGAGIVLGAVPASLKAGYEYGSDKALLDAKEQQALVQLCGAMADSFKKGYSSTQDLLQQLTDAHSRAVDAAQSMLKSQHAVTMTLTNNLSGR